MAGQKKPFDLKQKRFAQEYAIDCNGKQAAIRAGYSPDSAAWQACDLLTKPHVQKLVQKYLRRAADRAEISAAMVARELAAIGFSDITDYQITDNGHVGLHKGKPKSATRAVSSIRRKVRVIRQDQDICLEEVETEIKLWDKVSALKKLAERTGGFNAADETDTTKTAEPNTVESYAAFARYLAEVLAESVPGGTGEVRSDIPKSDSPDIPVASPELPPVEGTDNVSG